MKRLLTLGTVLVFCFCFLTGCGLGKKDDASAQNDAGREPDPITMETTGDSDEETVDGVGESSKEEDNKQAKKGDNHEVVSYLQKVPNADQSVFDGPSYDHRFVGTVEEAGTYTIVEEVKDEEGNLWGRLKSGKGWIDLTDVKEKIKSPSPISANFADDKLLKSGKYHHCIADDSEQTVQIAFRANETLKNVSFYSMLFVEEFEKLEDLYQLEKMTPDKPLVADVSFPGDMSMYGISFEDGKGVVRTYTVSINGRNGTLFISEKTK